jgi:addiction module RelE/StbE family toxin
LAKLSYSEQALNDLERLTNFLIDKDSATAAETLELIEEAVNLLVRHPFLGRPVEYGLRELVISRGRTGYVALYSLEEDQDAVLILAIRHQRETGYLGQEEDWALIPISADGLVEPESCSMHLGILRRRSRVRSALEHQSRGIPLSRPGSSDS